MKSFKQYTLLTEATDVSTALETVLGVCYEAASDSKNSATILKKGMKSAEFKKAKKYWQQKGKKPADRQLEIDNLMIFGKKILSEVKVGGTFEFQDKGPITQQWADWSGKKKKDQTPSKDTSKTDIILGGKQYSVKNANGAQLMSGKKGESIATASAAADMTGMTNKVLSEMTTAMDKLEEVTTEGYYASLEHLKILKDQGAPGQKLYDYAKQESDAYYALYNPWKKAKDEYDKKYDAWKKDEKKEKPKRDYGAEPKKPPQSILDIAVNPTKAKKKETYVDVAGSVNKEFLENMEGEFQRNSDDVKKKLESAFASTSGYKVAFVFEAATGRYKFGNQVQQAKHMLCWKPLDSGIQNFKVKAYPVANANSKIIKDYASQIGLEVNWKSGSTNNHLGYNAYQNVRLGLRDTVDKGKEIAAEHYEEFNEFTELLNEGVINEGAFWDKVKELANKFMEKAKALWNRFLNFFREAFNKIKEAAQAGIESLANIMGFEMDVSDTLLNNNSLKGSV